MHFVNLESCKEDMCFLSVILLIYDNNLNKLPEQLISTLMLNKLKKLKELESLKFKNKFHTVFENQKY